MMRYLARLQSRDLSLVNVDDLARLLHDEAQCGRRDEAGHLPGLLAAAPLRAARAGQRLPRALRAPRGLARRDHRLRRRLAAAQRRSAGRVHRPAGHPRLPPLARRGPPRHLPDPELRARHQPGERDHGRHARRGRRLRRPGQHRPRRPAREGRPARGQARGADGDLPLHARRLRGHRSPTSATSSTSTAARCTSTART